MSKFFTRRTLTYPAVLAVVFTILFFVLDRVCCYIDGKSGYMTLSYDMCFTFFPLYLILILFLAIWAVIGVCISFWRIRKISPESAMSAAVLFLVVAAPLVELFLPPAGAEAFIMGYKHWALEHVDIDVIQDWMAKAPDLYWIESETYSSNKDKPDVLPECLKDGEFQYVYFTKSDLDGSNVVQLEWGGPFSHYGIVVGSPQMKMPDKTIYKISSSYVEFRKAIKPGAYVYEGG